MDIVDRAWQRVSRIALPMLILSLAFLVSSCNPDEQGAFAPHPDTEYDARTGLPLEIVSRKDGAVMVLVRAGSFTPGPRGATGAAPKQVGAFYIDKYEVTNGRYARFVADTGQRPPALGTPDAAMFDWENGVFAEGRDECPVVLVSFKDAAAFAEWAGKELPAQQQWEYAARGPASHEFPWGDELPGPADANIADRIAGRKLSNRAAAETWYTSWSDSPPAVRNADALRRVGSFPNDVSDAGAFDLGGSVREWCIRKGNGHVSGVAPTVSSDALSGNARVVCGGSWMRAGEDARSWYYEPADPADSFFDVGFRCVVPASHPDIQALARSSSD